MRRKLSILLAFVILFSSLGVFAEGTKIFLDFEELREYIKNTKGQSDFKSIEDKKYFRHIYWPKVLPDYSETRYKGKPITINHDSVDNFKIFVYGGASMIPNNPTDSSGHVNYIGYTADGEMVVNMNYNEAEMVNPVLVPVEDYNEDDIPYYGNARPFKTDYTDFTKVGEMFLGDNASEGDKVTYGREVITEWMKNMRVRVTGFRVDLEGRTFYEVFNGDVDEFVKYVTITSPPTSRSNGQATVWFEHDAGIPQYRNPNTGKYATRRTYVIEPTDPVNFKSLDYAWDEKSKTLTVRYEIEGLEKVEGFSQHTLTQNSFPDKEGNYVTPRARNLPALFKEEYLGEDSGVMLWIDTDWSGVGENSKEASGNYAYLLRTMEDYSAFLEGNYASYDESTEWSLQFSRVAYEEPSLEGGKRKTIREIVFDLDCLEDHRLDDLVFEYYANLYKGDLYGADAGDEHLLGFPEYHPNAYYDNLLKITIPSTVKGLDLDFHHRNGGSSSKLRGTEGVDLKVPTTVILTEGDFDTNEGSLKTNINIYDSDGKLIDTLKDVEFNKSALRNGEVKKDIDLTIDKSQIKPGDSKFYAVINSDFDLTEAFPIEEEKNLSNNKIEIEVSVVDTNVADLSIYPKDPMIRRESKSNLNLEFNLVVEGYNKPIATKVDLYQDGTPIDSKNITISNFESVSFPISANRLKDGVNNFYAVVNADYNLTTPSPYKDEVYLDNNKTSNSVLIEKYDDYSGDCEFAGSGKSKTYRDEYYEPPVYDDDGELVREGYPYCGSSQTTRAYNHAKIEFINTELSSNTYRPDRKGQEYGRGKVSKGKDLDGSPAYDELMAKIGFNPLYQVIQTGRGMQVKAVIKITGQAEEFSSAASKSLVDDFVNDIKRNIYTGSTALNNEGIEYQKMIVNGNIQESIRTTNKSYGDSACTRVTKYTTTFDIRIPILIDKAKGTMDVHGIEPKPENPRENKYFVYMNTPDGVYQMALRADLTPRLLDVSKSPTRCIVKPNDFKFAVYGTIFDILGTEEIEDPPPYWDN